MRRAACTIASLMDQNAQRNAARLAELEDTTLLPTSLERHVTEVTVAHARVKETSSAAPEAQTPDPRCTSKSGPTES